MFANMGASRGSSGPGGGPATGGQGGLWPKGADGKRHPPGAEGGSGQLGSAAPLNAVGVDPTAVPVQRFSDPAVADAHLRAEMGKANITQAERESLEFYQGGSYEMVNGHMRGTLPFALDASERAVLDGHIANLNRAMQPLRSNIEVHRGMFVADDASRNLLVSWQPGATFHDPGFMSTTVDPRVARRFSQSESTYANALGQHAVDVRIRVPAGTPATYYNAVLPRGNAEERELLLGSGQKYRVAGRQDLPGGKVVIDLEILP